MKKIWNFIKNNWVVLAIAVVLVAVGIIATVHICKQERELKVLQEDYNSLASEYNSLVIADSLLLEDYEALLAEDSICNSLNQELAQACDGLRKKCDSLQAHPRVRRVVVNPPRTRTTKPRQTRTGGYPALDW